mgnify:CR=1 FL=1
MTTINKNTFATEFDNETRIEKLAETHPRSVTVEGESFHEAEARIEKQVIKNTSGTGFLIAFVI